MTHMSLIFDLKTECTSDVILCSCVAQTLRKYRLSDSIRSTKHSWTELIVPIIELFSPHTHTPLIPESHTHKSAN